MGELDSQLCADSAAGSKQRGKGLRVDSGVSSAMHPLAHAADCSLQGRGGQNVGCSAHECRQGSLGA